MTTAQLQRLVAVAKGSLIEARKAAEELAITTKAFSEVVAFLQDAETYCCRADQWASNPPRQEPPPKAKEQLQETTDVKKVRRKS
jgi:hypothetical protein